jgi:selenide,water dikinase
VRNENLIVASETYDDAGVYRLDDETALVQTVDVFTPVVDDPYWYGAVVAANSLSDVYAMGGRPVTVLGILGFPGQLDPSVMTEILKGSADVVKESGAVIAGGHTIIDNELKFGLAVTGLVHPDRVVRNSTARPGDRLVLTKPIGTGLVTTGIKRDVVKDAALAERTTRNMAALNRGAAEAMMEVGVNAATDITGYGLLGHSLEMANGSGVTLRFTWSTIPRLPEDVETLAESCMSGGTSNNRRYAFPEIAFHEDVDHPKQIVLFDAQTSGGLLISVPEERLDALVAALEANGVATRAVVGEVLPRGEKPLEVVP